MATTAIIDTYGWKVMTRDLARYSGRNLRDIFRLHAASLLKKAAQLTPPKNLGQGKKAVKRDIGMAAGDVDPSKMKEKWLETAFRDGEEDVLNAYFRMAKGGWAGYRAERFTPAMHTSVRSSRGRVLKSKKMIGMPIRDVQRYIREMQKRVGLARATWVAMGAELGIPVSAASWVLRNVSAAAKYTAGREGSSLGRFFLELTARTPHLVSGLNGGKILERALKAQMRSFERDVKAGVFRDLDARAKRYPGIFVI